MRGSSEVPPTQKLAKEVVEVEIVQQSKMTEQIVGLKKQVRVRSWR